MLPRGVKASRPDHFAIGDWLSRNAYPDAGSTPAAPIVFSFAVNTQTGKNQMNWTYEELCEYWAEYNNQLVTEQ
jgi:hypothetical protein